MLKLQKWLKNPTPENWKKLGLNKSQFARNLRAYLLDQPVNPKKGTGLDKASKELFDQIKIKKYLTIFFKFVQKLHDYEILSSII